MWVLTLAKADPMNISSLFIPLLSLLLLSILMFLPYLLFWLLLPLLLEPLNLTAFFFLFSLISLDRYASSHHSTIGTSYPSDLGGKNNSPRPDSFGIINIGSVLSLSSFSSSSSSSSSSLLSSLLSSLITYRINDEVKNK